MRFIREQQNIILKWANNLKQGRTGINLSPGLITLFIVLTAALAAAVVFFKPTDVIQLISDDNVLWSIRAVPDSRFYIDYTHSVEKTPVREVFVITDKGEFLLTGTEYSSFGAGLPTENFGSFRHENGKYINSGINKVFTEIRLRTGITADHRVIFGNSLEIVLSDFVKPRSLVIIKPVKLSRFQVFLELLGGSRNG